MTRFCGASHTHNTDFHDVALGAGSCQPQLVMINDINNRIAGPVSNTSS